MDLQLLFKLGSEYYQTAINSWSTVNNETQLREVFSLVKMSIICLNRILVRKGAVDTFMRSHCLFMKSEMIHFFRVQECDENNELIRAEDLLNQVKILALSHPSYLTLGLEAEVRLITMLIKDKELKIAFNMIQKSMFAQTGLMRYLTSVILIEREPLKALTFLQTCVTEFPEDRDPEISNLFKLMESGLALSLGSISIVNLGSIQTKICSLTIHKALLEVLYDLNTRHPPHEQQLEPIQNKMRALAELLTNNKDISGSFYLDFNIFQQFQFKLEIGWLDYEQLYLVLILLMAVSNLNTSFDKRKSVSLLKKCQEHADNQLAKLNSNPRLLNYSCAKFYRELKSQIAFYSLLEEAVTVGIRDGQAFDVLAATITDNIQMVFVKALKAHIHFRVSEAKDLYWVIISRLKHKNFNDDICILSALNYLLIVESELDYRSKLPTEDRQQNVQLLVARRSEILESITALEASESSIFKYKFLFKSTFDLMKLLYNYSPWSILEKNAHATYVIDTYYNHHLKNFPLLAAMFLYFKSFTLNENSDQKQKSSQLAFNLSKFGYHPLLRYVCGLLNQTNSGVARNLQQYDIQVSKNQKIQQQLKKTYSVFQNH